MTSPCRGLTLRVELAPKPRLGVSGNGRRRTAKDFWPGGGCARAEMKSISTSSILPEGEFRLLEQLPATVRERGDIRPACGTMIAPSTSGAH